MKNICVPVDFTHTAMNALKYAIQMFKGDKITVLNVSLSSLNSTAREYSLLGRLTTTEDDLQEELRKVILIELGLKELPENLSIIIEKGEAVTEIKNFVKNNNIDLVVMGTRDKYDILDKLIGTTSLAMVKTLDCPVYLIPRYATFKKFKKVIVAIDDHSIDNKIGYRIKQWNESYKAFVKFLHIQNDNKSFNKEMNSIVSELFLDKEPEFGFEIEHVKSKEIGSAILSSAYNFGADLIISSPYKQNFISALLFKSVTKELIQKVSIPILFVHENDIIL